MGALEVVFVTKSCLTLCNPIDCSRQAPLSMGFSRQEYWSGVPCLPSGDLPNPGIKPVSPISPAVDSLLSEPLGKPKLMVENLNQVFKRNSVMSLLLFLCSLYNFLSQIHTFFFHFISPLMACLNHDLSHSPWRQTLIQKSYRWVKVNSWKIALTSF